MFVSESMLLQFKYYLEAEEKSEHTISKYCRDVHRFILYASDGELTKQLIIHYKETLLQQGYAFSSINSMLASINAFLSFLGLDQMKVRTVKMQREIFYPEEKNLTHTEYSRLLQQALRQGKRRLYLLMQTIYATGIRVSELPYITVEAAKRGCAIVDCKGKTNSIRPHICHKKREAIIQKQYLERSESTVYRYRRQSIQSISAQPASSVCQMFL